MWCGIDAVCVVYKDFIGILGPDNSAVSMEYNHIKDGVYCISEIDGLRVVTTEHVEFWEKVDESL